MWPWKRQKTDLEIRVDALIDRVEELINRDPDGWEQRKRNDEKVCFIYHKLVGGKCICVLQKEDARCTYNLVWFVEEGNRKNDAIHLTKSQQTRVDNLVAVLQTEKAMRILDRVAMERGL